jgi:threonine dehydratase
MSTRRTNRTSSPGVGTYALEIFGALEAIDTVLVPSAAWSGACGLITVRDALGLKTRIIAVGAERADAVARSWRTGTRVVGESADTLAEGVATRVTFDLTFGILRTGCRTSCRSAKRNSRAGSAWRSISRTTWPRARGPHRSPPP